jgi:1,4-dihydroxy-2-naphthoate octaprenyltransferase
MQEGLYKVKSLRLFFQLSRPLFLLFAILLYIMGVGIARYLSGQVNWLTLILGLLWSVLIMLGFQYLSEYFDQTSANDDQKWWRTQFSGSSGGIGPGKLSRQVALWAGLTCLTISASVTVLMLQKKELSIASIVVLGLIFLGALVYSLPPSRLVTSGYGELIMSIVMVGMIPALAYLLQGREIHRLLIMVSFPLAIFYLSMLLALEFPSYASDIKHEKKTLLVSIGWQKGMQLHNILILCSFVMLGVALVFGLPFSISWSVIFILPLGIFQIWMMNRIGDGVKPNWNLLILTAISTFSLTAYLLTFSFWTH